MDEEADKKILSSIAGHCNAILLGIHAVEGAGKNQIPQALADYIGKLGDLDVEDDILQSNIVSHTGAGQNVRLFNRPKFDGYVKQGRDYILVMRTTGLLP
jgi:hypothetical protein